MFFELFQRANNWILAFWAHKKIKFMFFESFWVCKTLNLCFLSLVIIKALSNWRHENLQNIFTWHIDKNILLSTCGIQKVTYSIKFWMQCLTRMILYNTLLFFQMYTTHQFFSNVYNTSCIQHVYNTPCIQHVYNMYTTQKLYTTLICYSIDHM